MPYITTSRRLGVTERGEPAQNAGEFNYRLAIEVNEYIVVHGVSYQTFNDVIGALESLKHEIQRRFVDDYEDTKRLKNGDVFTFDMPINDPRPLI